MLYFILHQVALCPNQTTPKWHDEWAWQLSSPVPCSLETQPDICHTFVLQRVKITKWVTISLETHMCLLLSEFVKKVREEVSLWNCIIRGPPFQNGWHDISWEGARWTSPSFLCILENCLSWLIEFYSFQDSDSASCSQGFWSALILVVFLFAPSLLPSLPTSTPWHARLSTFQYL